MMVGLCDCNSFYASCEKLFRPDLRNKAVVVLSNNDGCVVALSKEAKKLGIQRGCPYYKYEKELKQLGAHVFSSNYELYQDISDRVMNILKDEVGIIMPYSIDEAFFVVPENIEINSLRKNIIQKTGIEVSIGTARTKTLAKIANHIGKNLQSGTLELRKSWEDRALKKTLVNEVWGIGRGKAKLLNRKGVTTAYDLTLQSPLWIKKNLTSTGIDTFYELKGQPMINLSSDRNINICSGITFSYPRETLEELEEALSCHCTVLSKKLIEKNLNCNEISIQIFTNRFNSDYISQSAVTNLKEPTNYIPNLIRAAKQLLHKIYRPGKYKGCRVWASNLSNNSFKQLDLLSNEENNDKQKKLSSVVNEISKTYGKKALTCASTNFLSKNDLMQQNNLSPCYTTKWKDLPIVKLD